MTAGGPFQGLAPFTESDEDARRFFGRDEQIRIIAANLVASRLTVLYGPSGVGKSSLLRAGAVHRLRADVRGASRVAVAYVGSWEGDPKEAVLGAVAEEAARLGSPAEPPPDGLPLDEALQAWQEGLGMRLLLILDQFEEYCLYHPPDEDPFDRELPQAIERRDLGLRFLLGVREDGLAALDRYKGRVNSLFGNRVRLEHLSRAAALAAIHGPIERYNETEPEPIAIEPGLAEAVLDEIAPGRVALATQGRGTAGGRSTGAGAGGIVETPYLQLVMKTLWEREQAAGSRMLRLETLRRVGGATDVVRAHVDEVVGRLTPAQQDIAASALHFLVTPSGAKVAHTAPDLATYAGADPRGVGRVLERLCGGDARLLRRVAPAAGHDEPRYEVFHDVLAPAILDWRSRLQARRERRRLATLLALIVALIVALVATLAYVVDPRWVRDAEHSATDVRASIGGPPVGRDDVTIVDFDKRSAAALTQSWPPDRRLHARMIDALRRAGAAVIAYDIQFEIAKAPASDQALQAAVHRAAGHVALSSFHFTKDDRLLLFGHKEPGGGDRLMAQLGAQAGYSGFPLAAGNIYRVVQPEVRYAPQSPPVPALSVVAARLAGADTKSGETAVPIDFRGGAHSYRTVSALDVLTGKAPRSALQGKVVFVGATNPTAGDVRRTPVGRMPGAEIHANAYTTIVRGRHPARDILIIALLALIPAAVARARPWIAAAVIAGTAVAYLVVAQLLFDSGWIVPVLLPLGALALSSAGLVAIRLVLARRAARRRPAPGAPREPDAARRPAASPNGEHARKVTTTA